MKRIRRFVRRLLGLLRKRTHEAEMSAEMVAHLDGLAERNVAAGMSREEARYAAQRTFGGLEQIKERCRDEQRWVWLEQLWRDVGFGLRSLRKSPGFTVVAVLSLGLAIGSGTSIFSLLNAVLLRALPVRAPHELRLVNWVGVNAKLNHYTGMDPVEARGNLRTGSSFPFPVYQAFRERSGRLASVFAFFSLNRLTVTARGEASATSGLMVSGNFFTDYGAATLIGRPLMAEDDRPGATPVTVITYGLWERRFGLDPEAIGQTITINQNVFTIVGVTPRDYVGPLPGDMAECYVTFAAQPALAANRPLDSANEWWVQIMARVASRSDEMQARAMCDAAFRGVLADSTTRMEQPGIRFEPGAQGAARRMREHMARPLFALLGIVGVVMAIACANVAGLLLARGAARQHEFAVRAAIGAGRWPLVRQALTESLLLALLAAGVGLILTGWGKTVLLGSLGPKLDAFRWDLSTDLNVLGFTLGLSLVTAVVFGLVPALRASRVDPLEGLKSRSALAAPRLRLGKVLVAAQVGFSALLVVGAGLFVRTFANLARVNPGFNPDHVLLFRVDPSQTGYKDEELARFFSEAERAIAAIPGVRAAAMSSMMLTAGASSSNLFKIPDRPALAGESREAYELHASAGFFATLGIPMVQGREFNPGDTATSLPVAVVNETFARKFFPGENPIGRTLDLSFSASRPQFFTIVGVSRDAKYANIRDAVPPVMCFCTQQEERDRMVFVVRSGLPPLSLVPAVRKTIARLNPNLPLSAIRTQAELVENSTAVDRLFAGLCSGLAGLALLLACIGLYGLMAYNVARRTSEIGVRMALGATQRAIAWPILRDALALAAVGLAVGLPAALAVAGLMRSQLYGVSPADPLTLAGGALLLIALAAFAAWMPARRASRIDPLAALRAE